MVVLVTGSSGFVGRKVVRTLFDRGVTPIAFDVVPAPPGALPDAVTFVQGTMANIEDVMGAIVEHRVEKIVALGYVMAPLNRPEFRDYTGAVRTNLLGITNVMEAARLLGVARVLFLSSSAVYGPQEMYGDRRLNEDDALSPASLYGMMKQVNEQIAREYSRRHGLQTIIVRPTAIFGAGNSMSPEAIVSLPAVGRPGYGNFPSGRHQNALAVADLADLVARIVLASAVQRDCYIASGHPFTWAEVASIVRRLLPETRITFNESVSPVEGGFAYQFDSSRAASEFNWKLHSLEESVRLNINEARSAAGLPKV